MFNYFGNERKRQISKGFRSVNDSFLFCFVFKIRAFHFKVYNQQGEQQEKKKIGEIKSQKNETDVGQGLKKKREQKREQEIL